MNNRQLLLVTALAFTLLSANVALGVTDEEFNILQQEVRTLKKAADPSSVVHLAGYGAAGYTDIEGGDGYFGNILFAPIFHYQINDRVMLESELEIEDEEDGETEVKLEYLAIDVVLNDYAVLVVGKFLSPIGQFRQNLHPSWINKLPSAPPGFGHGGAAPVSEVGAQLRGGFKIAGSRFNYAFYVGNGPEFEVEIDGSAGHDDGDSGHEGETGVETDHDDEGPAQESENEHDEEAESEHDEEADSEHEEELVQILSVHDVENEGFSRNLNDTLSWGGRLGWTPWPKAEIGLSFMLGEADGKFDLLEEGIPVEHVESTDITVYGADFVVLHNNLTLRGEWIQQKIDAFTAGSSKTDDGRRETVYVQASYRIAGTPWEPVIRYTDFEAPGIAVDQEQWVLGINYLVQENAQIKLAYESNKGKADNDADQDRALLQVTYGF